MRSDKGKTHKKSAAQILKELEVVQAKAECRRVGRPRAWEKMLSIAPMQSARVIREITRSFMP